MKKTVKSVFLMVVGPLSPKYQLAHILDTFASIVYYGDPTSQIIVMDNTEQDISQQFYTVFSDVVVLQGPQNYGMSGGLYKSMSLAMLYAYSNFKFDLLIKMDTDALMIGEGLEDEAFQLLRQQPDIGELGTYKIGCNGEISEFSWPREQLLKETSLRGMLQDRERCLFLRTLVERAQTFHYELGEHILGGTSIFSYAIIEKLLQQKLLLREELYRSILQEDHIFSLLVKAVGMNLADFGSPDQPLAVRYRGMPCSPQDALERGKKVVHSTRSWNDMDEDSVRQIFRDQRERVTASWR